MNAPFGPVVHPQSATTGAVLAGLALLGILGAGLVLDIRLLLGVRERRRRGMPGLWRPRHGLRLLRRPWTWADAMRVAVAVAITVAALLLAARLLAHFRTEPGDDMTRVAIIAQTLLVQGVALGAILHLLRRRRMGFAAAFGGPARPPGALLRAGLLAYVASMPPILAAAALSNILFTLLGLPTGLQPILDGFLDASAPFWFRSWLMATAVVGAPVVEELAFRGVFLPAVARARGIPFAIVAVSLLFAVIHGHPPAIAPLFVIGVALSTAYLATGSILVPIVMHTVFNGVNLAVLILAGVPLSP